jgi:glutamate-1-semialdehyde 2,1-aminomutase
MILPLPPANRVFTPFQAVAERLEPTAVAGESSGMRLRDVDGNELLDVNGSYGVNLCGNEAYKRMLAKSTATTADFGQVLGPLHPCVVENLQMLSELSGFAETSFHMSGTEAVMCALRLARFHRPGRKLIVTFGAYGGGGAAYHGWWDGVMPEGGASRPNSDCLVLTDMTPLSLEVLRLRGHEIAAVVVNPCQSFKPPREQLLLSARRVNDVGCSTYREWLQQLRRVCDETGSVLIFDEVYTGFRVAPGGAQELYGVRADMVTYGKVIGGGLPIGVVCGPKELMERTHPHRPMKAAYVIGTFVAHPLVMGCMHAFLTWVSDRDKSLVHCGGRDPSTEADCLTAAQQYERLHARVQEWVGSTNALMRRKGFPFVQVFALQSMWTITFERPCLYHWMFQYYLRDEGLVLMWIGTGKLVFNFEYTDADFQAVTHAIESAAVRMEADGWWWACSDDEGAKVRARSFVWRVPCGRCRPKPSACV